MTSLLPAHLSELERDLDAAIARIGEVRIPIATLWDPWNCSIEVLPFLAWALSVDQWRSDWPEAVKRRVVASSLDVHRIKGTRPAVEQGLRDLGLDAELVEWFESEPPRQPGTFTINLQTSIETQSDYDAIIERVKSTKNTRSWLTTVALRRNIELGLTFATATAQGVRTRMGPRPATPRNDYGELNTGTAQHAATRYRIAPWQLRLAIGGAATAQATAYHDYRHITIRG